METNPLFIASPRRSFLGTGWAFPPQFSRSNGEPQMVSGEEDVWQSLQILFSTSLKERRITPDYGCNLEDFVFKPLNISLLSLLEEMVREAIVLYEPRIKLNDLRLETNDLEGCLEIWLDYTIRSTNTRFNKVYPYYLTEGTNVAP